jgi:hypothetical protein
MPNDVYRYTFSPSLDIAEVEATVMLAILATESLHGQSGVRLELHHTFDSEKRLCLIDATGEVGRDLNRLFLGFVSREFGHDSFQVARVAAAEFAPTTPAV